MEFGRNIRLCDVLADLGKYNQEIVHVDLETTVEDLAALLAQKNILSVPIYDKRINDYVGIVDCFELLKYTTLSDYFKQQVEFTNGGPANTQIKEKDFEEFMFSISTVGELLNISDGCRKIWTFPESELLENAMRLLRYNKY
jgi:CBS domain containing-hemolysin-like protein